MTAYTDPNPVALLCDGNGVFGIGLSDEYLRHKNRSESVKLILRPDRIEETETLDNFPFSLQGLPPWHLRSKFNRTQEGVLRTEMIDVMRNRAGIPKDENRLGIPQHEIPSDANLRRHYFGLPITATRMFIAMMARVVRTADPEALRVARRFPLPLRFSIYKAVARSHRVSQIAEAFPLLAYRVFCQQHEFDEKRDVAIRMIERGAKLRDVAQFCGLPMRLRRIKPGAVHYGSRILVNQPNLLNHMPLPLPQMRRWMHDVRFMQEREPLNPDYAVWAVRNWRELGGLGEIQNIGDWVHSEYQMERPFVPTMSVRTVRQLSDQWHQAIGRRHWGFVQKGHFTFEPFPEPWFAADILPNGEEIVPITSNEDLYREGEAMHHCVASYDSKIIRRQAYIYSLRKGDQRIATIELTRDMFDQVMLGQIRGACNAVVPASTTASIRRWLASKNGATRGAPPC